MYDDTIASDGTPSVDSYNSQPLKAFPCPDCDKRFSTRFSRNRHYENQHRMESESNSQSNENPDSNNVSEAEDDEATISTENEDLTPVQRENEFTDDEDSIAEENEDTVRSEDEDSVMSEDVDEFYPFTDLVEEAVRLHGEELCQLKSKEDNEQYQDDEERRHLRNKISKSLRRIFVNEILDWDERKRDPLIKKIMRKVRMFEDDGFDFDEAVHASVDYWKHAINKLVPL